MYNYNDPSTGHWNSESVTLCPIWQKYHYLKFFPYAPQARKHRVSIAYIDHRSRVETNWPCVLLCLIIWEVGTIVEIQRKFFYFYFLGFISWSQRGGMFLKIYSTPSSWRDSMHNPPFAETTKKALTPSQVEQLQRQNMG